MHIAHGAGRLACAQALAKVTSMESTLECWSDVEPGNQVGSVSARQSYGLA